LSSISPTALQLYDFAERWKDVDGRASDQKDQESEKSKISEKVAPLGSDQLRISLRFFVHLSAAFISSVLGLAEKIVHGFCYRIPADAI
jgi:hypothetical protein